MFKSSTKGVTVDKVAAMFVDDAHLVAQGKDATNNVEEMLKTYEILHSATGGRVQEEKSKCFVWRHRWKQGGKEIVNMNEKTQLNNVELKQIDSRKCERTLGVHVGPSM